MRSLGKTLIVIVLGLLAQSCNHTWEVTNPSSVAQLQNSSEDLLVAKSAPGDFLALRYAYPNQGPSFKAFDLAKKEVARKTRSDKTLPGFNQTWRLEGPGNIGARINIIAPHPSNADTMLIGYSTGGIFKTIDGGQSWYPVFDQPAYSAISAIDYDPNDPNIVYAGTGDHNLTGYPFSGDGIHKSLDGGESWSQVGLEQTGVISKLIVDHTNSDILYAGTMGFPFQPDNNRGLYKSSDGGNSWNQILYISDTTGVIDVVMHPTDNNILLAAGWDRIRNNSTSLITGQGAKIYRSADAGLTWQVVTSGLPQDDQSRIGLTAVPSKPNKYYAEYIGLDFQVQGVYESNDAGLTWTAKSAIGLSGTSGGFGWYFGQIRSNPANDLELYHCAVNLYHSFNGGDNWSRITNSGNGSQHVDMHDVKFDADGNTWLATDGGLYRRLAGQSTWVDMENIPTTQFYRIAADPHTSESYYGGAQDNGTSTGDSSTFNNWNRLFGGDGFSIVFHPTNENVFYLETQNGNIYKTINNGGSFLNISGGIISPEVRPWDMFFYLDPFNPENVITGAQHVYLSDPNINSGTFQQISGNLTESDTASNARRFHFITHQSSSTLTEGLLYAGTSDGLLWKRADGVNWELINAGLPDSYVTRVVPSELDNQRLFVTHSGYKDGDNNPHIHISFDQGDSWNSIDGDLPQVGINDLIVIPNSGDSILFIGTDFGVFGSFNQGTNWELVGQGMPSVPVFDLDIDAVANRLLVGTYGRSAFSLDLTPILDPSVINITGIIKSRNDIPINNTIINVGNNTQTTEANGNFDLSVLPESSCEIIPEKFGPNNAGVSILDLILLQRHLVFLDTLPVLGQFAGDVNLDNDLSILDVIRIQRTLVFVDTIFESGPWGFVPEQFDFTDSVDAFSNPVPRTLDCIDATSNANFWGVKMGDVSGNASVQLNDLSSNRSILELEFEEKNGFHYLRMNQILPMNGFQLKFDLSPSNSLEIIDAIQGLTFNKTNDELYISWISTSGNPIELDGNILTLKVQKHALELSNDFENIAVKVEGDRNQIWNLSMNNGVELSSLDFTVFPNPNRGMFSISFQVPFSGDWRLMNLQGRLVDQGKLINQTFAYIDKQSKLLPGVYFLKLENATHQFSYKFIVN